MAKDTTADTSKAEDKKEDAKDTSEDTKGDESKDESAEDKKGDDSDASNTDKEEIDYDAEIEKENKRGKPNPVKAHEAFMDRKNKKGEDKTDEEDESDDDKPVTRGELAIIQKRADIRAQSEAALTIAKGLADSPKEAELVVARWKNRVLPADMPLSEQIEEVYAGMNAKKLIGEKKEALRALAGRGNANKSGTGSHHEGMKDNSEPKLPVADAEAIKAAGFAYNSASKVYEKKLPNGQILVKDPKTKATYIRK